MNCKIHGDREAVTQCAGCGSNICEDCAVHLDKGIFCKNCVSRMASANNSAGYAQRRGYAPAPPPTINNYYHPDPAGSRSRGGVNGFFLFCLSAIPGLNYMYMGLMKRGMAFLSTFFLLISIGTFFNFPFFAFAIFIEMCYSFFDGFAIRRKMLMGVEVQDNVDDIIPFFINNKKILAFGGVTLVGLVFFKKGLMLFERMCIGLFGHESYWTFYSLFSNLIGICIVACGIYIIYRAFFKKNSPSNHHNETKHDDYRQN